MLLDEVREHLQRKLESMEADPNTSEASRDYSKTVIRMLGNVDYILASPESLVLELLFFVGYDFDSIHDVYDALIGELSTTYRVASPEDLPDH